MPFKNPHPLYVVWQGMRRRCRNPNFKQWDDYGGRGISICARWDNFSAFVNDMGPCPKGYVIDRINVDGNYEPENCRWASKMESQRNRRDNQWVEIEGRRCLVRQLVLDSGRKAETIMRRAALGMSMAEVLAPEPNSNLTGLALGGVASGAKKRAMTHCKNGHEFTPENTSISKEGWRRCRTCLRDRAAGRI
ncbi:MAG: hypothetical protein AB7G35_21970 [Hyphomicrobiaceae bacterium]